ncbi:25704_t:CDS:2 [Gigaspora margarita]|uniref:25704_t:CDS:1 n=1 Tax=Gigaspora margarita TaxID=4874 RepID=A0ABN7VDU5_GIGMA|nr:25704_t:CDS:2 [Gigaspora margarita]
MGCKLVKHGKSVNLIMVDTPTDELIGINDDEKALQMAIEKVSALGMKQDQEIIPDNSVITTLKRYFDVIKFSMKAMKTYQLPRSEKPIPIIYFKAKTRKNLDIEFPEKSWIKIQEINGGKLDCIELDGDHLSVNFYPICQTITDYIDQYFKTNYQQESAHFSCFSFLKRIKLMKIIKILY